MSKIPKLRFKEFSGEWEEKKIEKFCNKIASGKSKQDENGEYNLYGSTGIIGKTKEYSNKGKFILIARVGANAGLTNVVEGCFGVTDNTLVLDLKDDIDTDFILSLLHKYNLNRLIFGSGQPLITGGQLKSLKLNLPQKQEQEKIASFLTFVDTKIEQLSKKEELLQQYKKGVMQKIFNQEIRFKADDDSEFGDWEEKKLDEIINVIDGDRGINYPTSIEFSKKEFCLFLNAKNVTKKGFKFEEKQFITEEKDNLLSKGKLKRFDIILTTRGSVGQFAFYDEDIKFNDIRINSGMVILRNNDKQISNNYLYKLFASSLFKKQIDRIAFGSAQPQLTVKEIKKFKILLPQFEEQNKIANFLSSIDRKIELVTTQLNQTKEFKKGLLQQMFV